LVPSLPVLECGLSGRKRHRLGEFSIQDPWWPLCVRATVVTRPPHAAELRERLREAKPSFPAAY
jgi:hypothetical protein